MEENKDLQKTDTAVAPPNPIKEFFASSFVVDKFKEILGNRAPAFITSVLQIANSSEGLKTCLPKTIFTAAATAATMDLPVNPNLGFAWIIGYGGQAQFQMGYKGYVQLAMRTGQYLRLNVIEVFKNQFKSWNELTEELDADFSIPGEGDTVGYCAYFKLINGFEKTVYWTIKKVQDHGKKYSKNYIGKNGKKSLWETDFDDMAKKTVLKITLSKWGILSVEMQLAIRVDQAVIKDFETMDVDYVDAPEGENGTTKGKKALQSTLNMMDSKRSKP